MKRSKFFLMGLALTACLLMAGCGSDSSDDPENPAPTPEQGDDTQVVKIKSIAVAGTYHYLSVVDGEGSTEMMQGGLGGVFNDQTNAKFTTKANGKGLHVTATATQTTSYTSTYSTTANISVSFDIDDLSAIASGKAVMSNIEYGMKAKTTYDSTISGSSDLSASISSLPMGDSFNEWKQTVAKGLKVTNFSLKASSEGYESDFDIEPIWQEDDYVMVQVLFTE